MDFQSIPVLSVTSSDPESPAFAGELPTTTCRTCPVRRFCLPSWLEEGSTAFERMLVGRRRVRKGQAIYREGDRFTYLYAVRYGTFKSAIALKRGRDQVMAFHMPGELFGFDGLASGVHPTTAIATEDAEVCAVPFAALNDAAGQDRGVRDHLTRMITTELVRERQLMSLVANTGSEERVAAFLLILANRMQERGYSARDLRLRMTREEIGSYLGTRLETVSRCLSALARDGYIAVRRQHIEILDAEGMRECHGLATSGMLA